MRTAWGSGMLNKRGALPACAFLLVALLCAISACKRQDAAEDGRIPETVRTSSEITILQPETSRGGVSFDNVELQDAVATETASVAENGTVTSAVPINRTAETAATKTAPVAENRTVTSAAPINRTTETTVTGGLLTDTKPAASSTGTVTVSTARTEVDATLPDWFGKEEGYGPVVR